MSASFPNFASQFCELAGFTAPRISPVGNDRSAFSVRIRRVLLTFVDAGHGGRQSVALAAELDGPEADDSAAWIAMLEANAVVLPNGGPRFSMNPGTGRGVLQWQFQPDVVSRADVYQRVLQIADVALAFRHDSRSFTPLMNALAIAQEPQGSAPAEDVVSAARARFIALHSQLCDVAGAARKMPAAAPALQEGPAYAFKIHFEGIDVHFAHFPALVPDFCVAMIDFGIPRGDQGELVTRTLLGANFMLIAQPNGTVFCRNPATGAIQLRYAVDLRGAKADSCLVQLANLMPLAQQWRSIVSGEANAAPAANVS